MSDVNCCGCVCGECEEYENENCPGCRNIEGRPSWIPAVGLKQCPYYVCCVTEHGFQTCGECGKLPCKIYSDCVDPSVGEEEAERDLQKRLQRLDGRLER